MRKETEQLLMNISSHLVGEEDVKFKKFINQVKESEKVLTKGGYMQDSNGTLVKSGDFISFQVDNHAPESERGVVYAQMVFHDGRFELTNGNFLLNIGAAGIYDMVDLKEAGFKFFKVEPEDFDEEAILIKVNGVHTLLKPEIFTNKKTGEKFIRMYDADSNYYAIDGSDDRIDWVGSHF